MTSCVVRACLFAMVLAHTLSTRGSVSGEDKPRPRWELKDKPSVWESTWRNCDDGESGGAGSNAGRAGLFSVKDVIPSPGSFAGRTGHSGSTKFVVDTNGKRVEDGRVIRQASYEGHSSASETMDLCEWTEDCPLGPGDRVTLAGKRLKVPWYSPPGNYKFKYELQDKQGALLFCAEVDLRMGCPNGTKVCPGLPLV